MIGEYEVFDNESNYVVKVKTKIFNEIWKSINIVNSGCFCNNQFFSCKIVKNTVYQINKEVDNDNFWSKFSEHNIPTQKFSLLNHHNKMM